MALPLTKAQAYAASEWMKGNFAGEIASAVKATPFTVDIICGIACQETAYFWLSFIKKLTPDQVLARCVLDASGDFPGTHRNPFPRNTAAFRARYDEQFADMLIVEANETRLLRGFKPASWVYKGYGVFQYDLQYVETDEGFFRDKEWYQFTASLERAMKELVSKYKKHNDLWKAIRAYNGSGPSATDYANNVIQFAKYASEVGA